MGHLKYPVIDGKKQCGTCREWKPIGEYKKARKHYDTKCKSCRKIYSFEYRNRPERKEADLKYHQEYMKDASHRKRVAERSRKYRLTGKYKPKKNLARRKWAAAEKQKAVEYKGGKCCVCGYSKCAAALDFHHLDPSQKDGYGTGALKSHWTFERNKPEIDKCILVCVRCHREIHAGVTECPAS